MLSRSTIALIGIMLFTMPINGCVLMIDRSYSSTSIQHTTTTTTEYSPTITEIEAIDPVKETTDEQEQWSCGYAFILPTALPRPRPINIGDPKLVTSRDVEMALARQLVLFRQYVVKERESVEKAYEEYVLRCGL